MSWLIFAFASWISKPNIVSDHVIFLTSSCLTSLNFPALLTLRLLTSLTMRYFTVCPVFFLQIFGACRVFWTRRPVRAWTWPCREWTETSVKSSPTSSPPWGRRSWIGTETRYVEPSCCSAPTEHTPSSSRSVHLQVIGWGYMEGACLHVCVCVYSIVAYRISSN